MVVLLVAMAVSAVWITALLPAWRQQVTREREAELIFRGEQYARAIFLYRQKNNQTLPPNVDVLVSQRYLRKKYKDPITAKDFLPVGGVANATGGGVVGVSGVRSTSNDTSLVVYRNQQTYSQFPFDWGTEAQKAGSGITVVPPNAPGQGRQGPGQPGQGAPGTPVRGRGGIGGVGGIGGSAPAPPPGGTPGRGAAPPGGVAGGRGR